MQYTVSSDLDGRVTQLNLLVSRVNGSVKLAPSDKASLLGDLTRTELPGIEALQTTVRKATTCRELRRAAYAMVFHYRVYLVMTPQVDLVIANDAALHAAGVLAGLEATASARVHAANSHGGNVSDLQNLLVNYETNVTAAQRLISAQSAAVLQQSPKDFPHSQNVFRKVRSNISKALHDLYLARSDLARIA